MGRHLLGAQRFAIGQFWTHVGGIEGNTDAFPEHFTEPAEHRRQQRLAHHGGQGRTGAAATEAGQGVAANQGEQSLLGHGGATAQLQIFGNSIGGAAGAHRDPHQVERVEGAGALELIQGLAAGVLQSAQTDAAAGKAVGDAGAQGDVYIGHQSQRRGEHRHVGHFGIEAETGGE